MPLIVEGSDHLGKTTLCKALVKHMNELYRQPIRYGHMSRPPNSFDFFDHYQDWTSKLTVQDRFHLGALVWHDGVLPYHRLRIVEGRLLAQGSMVVVVYGTHDEDYRRWLLQSNRDQMFNTEALVEANAQYRQMVKSNRLTNPVIDMAIKIDDFEQPFFTAGQVDDICSEWVRRLNDA